LARSTARHVWQLLPDLDFGGVETATEITAGLQDRGWNLTFVATRSGGRAAEKLKALGCRVLQGSYSSIPFDGALLFWLRRLTRKESPSLIHARCAEANFHGLLSGMLGNNVPCLVEEVGLATTRSRLAHRIFARLYRRAAAVLYLSQEMQRGFRKEGYTGKHQEVLPYPIRPEFLPPPPQKPRNVKTFRILSVGRLVWEKAFADLLQAAAHLRDQGHNFKINLCGEGPEKKKLSEKIRELSLGGKVRLCGFVPGQPEWYAEHDLFVLPSVQEGLGLVVAEALASGVPVVATRTGGVPEILGEASKFGTLVSPSDPKSLAQAMVSWLKLPATVRQKRGAMGRTEILRKFSPGRYLDRLEKLYLRLIAKP